jgi:hypothetical protein
MMLVLRVLVLRVLVLRQHPHLQHATASSAPHLKALEALKSLKHLLLSPSAAVLAPTS